MEIIVESNLRISRIFEPPLKVHLRQKGTLRDLLVELEGACGSLRFLEVDTVGEDVRNITVNGQEVFSLPDGLNTPLKNGDRIRVEIYADPLGGG